MATLAATLPTILNLTFTGTTNIGQAAGWTAVTPAGDLIPVTGQGTIFRVKSVGTAVTVTINSVKLTNYGTDVDQTMVLAATDEQEVFLKNDGRYDQGGANIGLAAVTYSATPTGVLIAAKVIPGSL